MAGVRNALLGTPECVPIRAGDIHLPAPQPIDITHLMSTPVRIPVLSPAADAGPLNVPMFPSPKLSVTTPHTVQHWYSDGGPAATAMRVGLS